MNRNFKELMLASVIIVSIVLGASAAFAWSSEPVDAPTSTTVVAQLVESPEEIENLKVRAFAEAYEVHLVNTWVDNTNWNLWMGRAAEVEAAEAAELRRRQQERAAVAAASSVSAPSASSPSSGRCGGNLPPCCVMQRESGGSLTAQNPTSSASGKWQFISSTWNGYGGYAEAWMAPESVQDARAAELWAGGNGAGHWGGGC